MEEFPELLFTQAKKALDGDTIQMEPSDLDRHHTIPVRELVFEKYPDTIFQDFMHCSYLHQYQLKPNKVVFHLVKCNPESDYRFPEVMKDLFICFESKEPLCCRLEVTNDITLKKMDKYTFAFDTEVMNIFVEQDTFNLLTMDLEFKVQYIGFKCFLREFIPPIKEMVFKNNYYDEILSI